MHEKQLFDDWPERYEQWFESPVGRAVRRYESELIIELLRPGRGDRILDAGSGTGIFTREFITRGAKVVALDISLPMLAYGMAGAAIRPWRGVAADMTDLPFADGSFDKAVSVAALEFVPDERRAVAELFRVTKDSGVIVVATLNSLSPWAARRIANAERDPHSIFNRACFRSPAQILSAAPVDGIVRTAIHFGKEDDPATVDRCEREAEGRETGAFVAVRWIKP